MPKVVFFYFAMLTFLGGFGAAAVPAVGSPDVDAARVRLAPLTGVLSQNGRQAASEARHHTDR